MSAAKLTIVVRADLCPAQQAVQMFHAGRQFAEEYPEVERTWFQTSNTVAFLAVPDEKALMRLLAQAADRGTRISIFREPDLDNQMTAACFEPGPSTRRLCGGLPRALGGR